MLSVNRGHKSPNFTDKEIPVEFVVLHYTACSLKKTIELLCGPESQASSHFVLDTDGTLYELVSCLDGPVKRAWHAGKSRYLTSDGTGWEGFNDFSVGVEIVNANGNVWPYTDAQYSSLENLLKALLVRHPAIRNPARVVGHEEIAGWRGKLDPGRRFDWQRLYSAVYPGEPAPAKIFALPQELEVPLRTMVTALPDAGKNDDFTTSMSLLCESLVGLLGR